MPTPPTLDEARTFDRLVQSPVFLRVWANSVQDRPWWWGATEPRRVRIARIAMAWNRVDADPAPPAYPTWRQEAAALLGLALGALLVVAVVAAGLAAAAGRVREAWGGGL